MEVSCSFKSLAGGTCGVDTRDKGNSVVSVVSLLSCSKDISSHKASCGGFAGPENEVDLILCRVAKFSMPDNASLMTICPLHRARLGTGWSKGSSTTCRIPPPVSNHSKTRKSLPKGDRGLGKDESKVLLKKTGIFIPVGSGICKTCRSKLKEIIQKESDQPTVEELQDKLRDTRLDKDVTFKTPQHLTQVPTPHSATASDLFSPSALSQCSDISMQEETKDDVTPREKLNLFLASRDVSPIRHVMTTPWTDASERTKRLHVRKAKQVIQATLEEIAPQCPDKLFDEIQICSKQSDDMNSTLLDALVECYGNASHWSSQRQILSIMADKVRFSTLQEWIPGLSRYRYNIARQHRLLHGRGTEVVLEKQTRMRVSQESLDHFLAFITSTRIIQDLPFGQKTLKLSSGTEITIPNVVRSTIPSHIIKQYNSYCVDTGFQSPLRRSSLYRILKVCSASTRTSLQGLDYYTSDGAKAFDDLIEVVQKLGDRYENGLTWSKEMEKSLRMAKSYMKVDYKVHVSSSSRVADHCRAYALSHAKDPDYSNPCNHQHDEHCDRCEILPALLKEIESVVRKVNLPQEESEELMFVVSQSKKNIEAWKAHLLRSVNQDEARLDIQKGLDNNSVLVVLDWAMKFVPRKFRESQADWFGKRGISWHISVAIRQTEGLEMLTLVHVFEKSNQDSYYVLAIIDDVIHKLKCVMPELKFVNLRQDNAGCYHSSLTILGVQQLALKHNVAVRMDFSDPQGGKGPCDRKAANIKNHMRSYLNSGNDITNAAQMRSAIIANGGLQGVSVFQCESLEASAMEQPFPKWDGVSMINDIVFGSEGMVVWRAYNMGSGKSIPHQKLDLPDVTKLPTISTIDHNDLSPTFCGVKPRRSSKKKSQTSETSTADSDTEDGEYEALFTCPEEGCIKAYQRYSNLERHLDFGKHHYSLEKESFIDKAKLKYAENLESGESSVKGTVRTSVSNQRSQTKVESLPMGWALKGGVATGRRRFSEHQKKYMKDLFILGEETGRKADPQNVAKAMRKARSTDGSLLFKSDEYLTSKQIAGFFSRLSSKKSLQNTYANDDDDDDLEDILLEINENEIEKMREEVLDEMLIKHPISYDNFNICEMTKSSKLTNFTVPMLRDICTHLELDISSIKQKRKKPYVDLLVELVKSCSCQC